jgi:antitoxin HicB
MKLYKIRLELELNPGPDRVYTVTSPDVPGLVTEGSTPEEIRANVTEALEGLILAYREVGKELPPALQQPLNGNPVAVDLLISVDATVLVTT